MPSDESRYEQISRRAFLRRTAAVGLAAAVPSALLAACGSDADTFASTVTTAAGATATTGGAATTTSGATSTTTTAAPSTTTATGASLPDGAELTVDFTYDAGSSSRGPVRNPYVAVWVEDGAGDLVATIALWFLQSQEGVRWLNELRRWATVDGSNATIDVISSATRAPGEYRVVWDGTTADGSRVAQGDYYIAIEAAREHGPYSLIREPIALGAEAFTAALTPEGEIADAAVSLALG